MKVSIMFFNRVKNNLYSIYSILFLICIWQIVASIVQDELTVPTVWKVFHKIIAIVKGEDFLLIILATLARIFLSFFLGLIGALFFGILGGIHRITYEIIYPIISIIRSVPTMSIIIIALLWLGQGKAPIFIGFVIVFPLIFSIVVEGIHEVDKRYIELAICYQVPMKSRIKDIYFPSIRGAVLAGIQSTLALNFKVMIAAEVLGQPEYAIGTMIMMEKRYLDMAGVFAWSIILIIMAALVDLALKVGIRALMVE